MSALQGCVDTDDRIKVAIANDTVVALEVLCSVIAMEPAYELIWTAKNGTEAVRLCQQQPPDLVLMALLMPGLDGVAATQRIMATAPCAILLVTDSVHGNASNVFKAMGCGALDVVSTPAVTILTALDRGAVSTAAAQPLLAKMATLVSFIGKSGRLASRSDPEGPARARDEPSAVPELIVMGASTGGPKALATVLGQLPVRFKAAIVVVQHIDRQFAPGLVGWLNQQTPLSVTLAQKGDRPQVGKVLIAKADHHLMMQGDLTLTYGPSEVVTPYCPSVDVFFKSVAEHWPHAGKAVLLTGMGRDGAAGLGALREAHWQTIAESEESCVVYGMPRAAVACGAASDVLAIAAIAPALLVHRHG